MASNSASAPETPHWNTGVLWLILGAFLVVGTAGAAFFVYGLLTLLAGGWVVLYVPLLLGGLAAALLSLLFMAGILYRIDRYRGTLQREVKFFE
ncbi:MAG: hypothetical protein AAFA34_00970 [Thermoplasmata archaeon]|jgi:membrane protein implicated in regulation of membrane protease activity